MNDREQILTLMAEYCLGTDTGDTERWVNCFTDDIVWDGGAYSGFSGKDGAREYHRAAGDNSLNFRHINTNHIIRIDGEGATSVSYIQVYDHSSGAPMIVFSGFYKDVLQRQGGNWLIHSRTLVSDVANL